MRLPSDLMCLFTGRVEKRDGSYVVEVPEHEVAVGDLAAGDVYRVGILPRDRAAGAGSDAGARESESGTAAGRGADGREPPVGEGDVLDVEIEDIGDQGDGVGFVGPGYVVIVPDTERGERVAVRITEARENMAFGDVVERYDR